jgi:hypothetical protein
MNATPETPAKAQGLIRNPQTLEDYIHNVRFHLDNVDLYYQMHRDHPKRAHDDKPHAARITATAVVEAATVLRLKLESACLDK